MEQELATLRSSKREPQHDPVAFRTAFVADPIGTLTRMGAPVDHVTRVLVAHAMGEQAPPELRVLAAMGPQVSATSALDSKVDALSRQVSTFLESQTKAGTRSSFQALAADKTKYPHLAKAFTADPSLFDDEVATGENALELAAKLEARLTKVAAVYAPPTASEGNADQPIVPSTKDEPAALAGTTSGGVPPIPRSPTGVITPAEDKALRDEIVRKYSARAS